MIKNRDLDAVNGASGGGGIGLGGAPSARGDDGGEEDLDDLAFGRDNLWNTRSGEPSGGVPVAQVAVSSENIDRIRTALHVAVDSFFNALEEL
jgi:hypothetical protein